MESSKTSNLWRNSTLKIGSVVDQIFNLDIDELIMAHVNDHAHESTDDDNLYNI